MLTTAQALAQFAADYSKTIADETGFLPQVSYDSEWSSPCEVGKPTEAGNIQWRYVSREQEYHFENIEHALEMTLHHDVIAYYGSGYSGPMFVTAEGEQIELLQVWNEDDLTRLCENLIGHLLMQRKLKQSPSVFIGCVVNSESMLSIDNNSGEVIIEVAGNKERRVVASSLTQFFESAQILVNPDNESDYQAPKEIKAGLMPRLKEVMKSLLGKH